ncbi:MAG TPA: AarF/UbiB family protein [Gemmatimonadaceae bacterium]|jgi:predicted unusual protein kinase regulating ubiquinone biosynthesis (AarF/ABC1/UbiB family)|nr:AarF/UbiB family protein [Gemmatimonadaceae bacterium]
MWRALVIVARLGPLVASFWRDRRRYFVAGAPLERSWEFHKRRAQRLVDAVISLGPTFIKLGQVFAARADLLPEPYVGEFGKLTDQVPPSPTSSIRAILLASYGRPLESIFERFDDVAVAAASLGQVHRAQFQGQDVAVKVLRPGVRELVRQDIRIAVPLARWIARHFPNPHIKNARTVVEEFARRIPEEMDFEREAVFATTIRANFAKTPGVIVPHVIPELVRPNVLVLEYIEGKRIDRLTPSDIPSPRQIVAKVIELYIQMMLIDGLFHADPHPGNLLVTPEGTVVLLDFGMVIEVPKEMRRNLVRTVFAAIRRDVTGTLEGFRSLGLIDPHADLTKLHGLAERLMTIAYDRGSMQERLELVANEVMATLYDWPVTLPSEMVYFARTAALIEGLGARYDQYFNAVTFAAPIAIRLRGPILRSLQEAGVPAPIDWATAIGAALGFAARRVVEFGERLLTPPNGGARVLALPPAERRNTSAAE